VLQEMLTNALKHGRRGEPVRVERRWQGDLRIEVQNAVSAPDGAGTLRSAPTDDTLRVGTVTPGRGLDGMRRRLDSVGDRLDLRRRDDAAVGTTFTSTARVPLQTWTG
jgi:anti-sigma regulatory factor (Ser/Thr protein kinase)